MLSGCQTLNGVAYQGEDIPGSQLTGDNNITDVEDCRSIELETKPGNTGASFRLVSKCPGLRVNFSPADVSDVAQEIAKNWLLKIVSIRGAS